MTKRFNLFDEFKARGFVQQVTDEEAVRRLFEGEKVAAYIGFDPTASSLHVGSLVQILMLVHLERAGHRPIGIVGGGTGLVGDPSGREEMRQLLSPEKLRANFEALKAQLGRFLDVQGGRALVIDNAEWIAPLNYIDFLRDIGRHFSVNRMLAAEAYRIRLEKGLSFIEFNYQLLQAYDFLILFRRHGCRLQMGGDDQWGNILAGTDLIRREEGGDAHGLTSPLLATADGKKMGKTAQGAVWLDGSMTSPYDFYQYWINVDDRDVERFLKLFTFLPLDEISRLSRLQGAELREAKKVLATEVTRFVHGEEEAAKAEVASRALFDGEGDADEAPTTAWPADQDLSKATVVDILVLTRLASSRTAASNLVKQGGVTLNGNRVDDFRRPVSREDFGDQGLLIRVGKKRYHRVVLS